MNAKRVAGWAVTVFLAWYMITNPVGAAHATTSLLSGLQHVGNSIATFFNSL